MNDWDTIPTDEVIANTAKILTSNNMETFVVNTKAEALAKLKSLIPDKAELNTASSTSLKELGFMEHLRHESSTFNYLGDLVRAENDEVKRKELRRRSIAVEYFVSSVNAVTQQGQLVAVDASGSRVGTLPYAAEKVIVVVSANKIVKDLDTAFKRIKEYVFPLEDKRMKTEYGMGSSLNKWLIMEREFMPGRTQIIIVKEKMGF